MLKSLRARLLASYLFVLSLVLMVIGVALLLMLGARPLPTEEISLRLATSLLTLRERPEVARIAEGTDGPSRFQQRSLNTAVRQAALRNTPIRIIVFRPGDKVVSYDSSSVYGPNMPIDYAAEPYILPAPPIDFDGEPDAPLAFIRGNLKNAPDGGDWRYVAHPIRSNAGNFSWWLLLAVRGPRQLSFQEIVSYYGEDVLRPLVQAGVIAFVVALALSYLITRSVARPLQAVAATTAAVAKGDLSRRAPVGGVQEVRTMAEAFNQMAEQAAAAQIAQRDFMANITHDLRTPLTSIQGFSQAIKEGVAANPAAAQRAAQIIYDEAGRLNRMVEELLDLARVEAGRWNMTRQTIQLDDILIRLGERLSPKAASKGLTLHLDIGPVPPIAGDGDRLVQVFTNLTDNAIKHTPAGGTVTLRAILQDQGVWTQIKDTGEGIPEADLPHIFDRFYQVDKSRQREQREGAGLGLTITKGIVEAHGGKIWAESKPGQGTTFTVWLPAPATDATTIMRRRQP
jgi:signal transduction histidine kinase